MKFAVNTTGYTNLSFSFDFRESATASRYLRVQYTTDGSTFIDLAQATNTTANTYFSKTNSLVGVAGVDNNPNFAVRIVTEWESTAIGSANANYVGVSSTYGTGGTLRYDMVTLSGTLFGTLNMPPIMSVLTNQTTRSGQPTNQSFTIGDAETIATSLVVTSICNNTTLVPNANIVVTSTDGSGSNRLITVTPTAGQVGTATITLFVVDGGTLFASRSFTLTVLPLNTPPTVTGLVNTNTLVNTPVTIPFIIGDAESAAASLTLSSSSTYTAILPNGGISFGGSGSNRTVTITPALNQTGVAVASVTVSDGSLSTTITFSVMVTPTPDFIFNDPFTYNDAPLVGLNTGNLWQHHSGAITGEVQVAGGTVTVDEVYAEDVNARLIGAPYYSTNAGGIYTKVTARLDFLPTITTNVPFGTYFLHLKDDGLANFRARVIVTITNAAVGSYRLAIANATSTNAPDQYPLDLSLGVSYTIVTRYDLVSGLSTLWINPTAETDPSVTATDPVNLSLVSGVALRQAVGIGSVVVDDLIVGKTFNAALGNTGSAANTPPLISSIANVLAASGTPTAPISVTIGDAETAAGSLVLTAVSSNQTLLPNASIAYGGSGSNRTLTLTTVNGQFGSTMVFVSVTDGVFTNSATFTVNANPALLLADSFGYANGPLVTRPGSLFTNFSGTSSDMIVSNGALALSFSRGDDAAAPLTNSPYAPASGVILYAGMTLNFSALPNGSYFAFFKDASSTFRGKIFGTTVGAAPGTFRFSVMNTGSTLDATNPVLAVNIPTNASHRVILRYEVATGLSTLWVNPAGEGDPSITGNDFAGPATISTFAFRQNSGMGTMALDNLLVGTTFQAVLGEGPRPSLSIRSTGANTLAITWPASATAYSLVSTTNNPAGAYTTYPDQGVTQGGDKVVNITNSTGTVFFQLKK